VNYFYVGVILCPTNSCWQGSSCGKLPRDRTVLSISQIHVRLISRLLQIAIEDRRVVWLEWDGYNHAQSGGHFAACTDQLVTWRAYDWLVFATLVSGIVADRIDSRPYVSELQDCLVVVSVRYFFQIICAVNKLWTDRVLVQLVVIIVCEMWIYKVSNNSVSVNHPVPLCQKVLLCVFVGVRSLRPFYLHGSHRIPSGAHLCAARLASWLVIIIPWPVLISYGIFTYLPLTEVAGKWLFLWVCGLNSDNCWSIPESKYR
jgi:hypothetical protein